jgi:hypothetical protein
VRVVGVLVLGHTDVDHLGHPVVGPQVGGDRRLVADAGVVPTDHDPQLVPSHFCLLRP